MEYDMFSTTFGIIQGLIANYTNLVYKCLNTNLMKEKKVITFPTYYETICCSAKLLLSSLVVNQQNFLWEINGYLKEHRF